MSKLDLIAKIINQLKNSRQAAVAQIPETTAQAWLINKLITTPRLAKSGVLVVAADEADKDQLISNLNFWQQINVTTQPIYDFTKNRNSLLLALSQQKPLLAVTTLSDLKNPLPPVNNFLKACLKINVGEKNSPPTIIRQLDSIGYLRQTRVFLPGEMAKRGEIVDVFPVNDTGPVRIEFKDKCIDKLYYFDLARQTAAQALNHLTIAPNSELTDNLTARIKDYLKPDSLIISPADLPLPAKDKNFYHLKWHALIAPDTIPAGFTISPGYQKQIPRLITDLKTKKDWTVYVAAARSLPPLSGNNILTLTPQPYLNGFINQSLKLWLVTDHELGLTELKEAKPGPTSLLESELKIGDYVVHIDHGIAKFAGLTKQTIDNNVRECFVLHYAQGDKLYVPIDRLDRISQYVGLSRPKLHRLSGTSWATALIKIKKETWETARRLINLHAARQIFTTPPLTETYRQEAALAADFPWTETPDQIKALQDINNDLTKPRPMDRLVCGDVGFGKTEIALRTAFKMILPGQQVALLCPTTILAQQHFDNFQARLKQYEVKVALLSRFKSSSQQNKIVQALKQGEVDIVIGTHRLLSDDIVFKKLGLIIIDEEQKFGVTHKEWLKQLRLWTHVLTLSATPIPRTLYFSLTGIKPISLIATPPPGRLPIKTFIQKYDQKIVKTALADEISRGGQAYYLYNRVESIAGKASQLKKLIPQARLGIAHGQLPAQELAATMHKFDTGEIDVLVCSTIIENGLDLPNVNTLIVEQAPRFGLAQLYQLRGRIGRSPRQAYAYFFYAADKLTGLALKRLQTLESAQELGEGFAIAKRDMELRGIGNLLGKQQHGQVKTIGLNLYLMLLEQTIAELKTGKIKQPETDISLDLPLSYNVPDSIAAGQPAKFALYQKLAAHKELDKLNQFVKEKFGHKLPEEFKNLLDILKIKILAPAAGVTLIDTINLPALTIILHLKQALPPTSQAKIIQKNNRWLFKNNKMKMRLEDMNKNWPAEIIQTLMLLR